MNYSTQICARFLRFWSCDQNQTKPSFKTILHNASNENQENECIGFRKLQLNKYKYYELSMDFICLFVGFIPNL